jgi:DNA polymerase-3 subunit beta
MKFTAQISDLQKCLQKTIPAINARPAFELLELFSFELVGNELTVIASDIEITILSKLTVQGTEDGGILVSAKTINDIVKGLPADKELSFEASEDDFIITLKSGKSTFELQGIDIDEYIELSELFKNDVPKEGDKNTIFFKQDTIKKMADKTFFAISKDDYRVNMCGVLFQFRETYVNAVSTDSFRLIRYTHFAEGGQKFPADLSLLIPEKAMDIFRKIDADAILSYDSSKEKPLMLRIDYGNVIMVTKLIKETFPKYESIIPVSSNCNATFDISAFLDALKIVNPVVNPTTKQCKLEFSKSILKIIGEDSDKGRKGTAEIQCELENADDFIIVFNIGYLNEMVSNISSNETTNNLIDMYFINSDKAALIKPKSDTDQVLEILMPTRLG